MLMVTIMYCLCQECENGVSLDYLQKLHHEYVKFINEIRFQGSQVLQYDWSSFKDEKIVSLYVTFVCKLLYVLVHRGGGDVCED